LKLVKDIIAEKQSRYKNNIETMILEADVTLTNKCLYFPCWSSRPKTEYVPFIIYHNSDVLVLATENQKDLERNLLEGLLKIYLPHELPNLGKHLEKHKDILETKLLDLMYKFDVPKCYDR